MRIVMLIPLILLTLALAGGCDEDERYVRLAQEADRRQAEQNQEIARQNHELAAATKELVAADAKSRQEMVALSRDLQAERAQVGRQRDALEAERRDIAGWRLWDSLTAAAIDNFGLLVICALPLVVSLLLLRDLHGGDNDQELGELLTIELTAQEPSLLLPSNVSSPRAERLLPHETAPPAATNGQDDDLPF